MVIMFFVIVLVVSVTIGLLAAQRLYLCGLHGKNDFDSWFVLAVSVFGIVFSLLVMVGILTGKVT